MGFVPCYPGKGNPYDFPLLVFYSQSELESLGLKLPYRKAEKNPSVTFKVRLLLEVVNSELSFQEVHRHRLKRSMLLIKNHANF